MDLDEALRKRRSVRSFTGWAPPETAVIKIVEAANLAPSAGGLKARSVLVVKGKGKRTSLAEAAGNQEFVAQAPYVLVICTDIKRIEPYGDRGRDLYCIQDASAAAENALLKITDLGLGGCWVGAFDEDRVKEVCGLPDYLRPVCMIPFGYEK